MFRTSGLNVGNIMKYYVEYYQSQTIFRVMKNVLKNIGKQILYITILDGLL